jgi:alcohol oxidase
MGASRWGYKKMREIIRRMKMYRGEVPSGHPNFPRGSLAECKAAEGPVDTDAPDIVYSKDDDDAIDQFHREQVGTNGHSVRNSRLHNEPGTSHLCRWALVR